MSAKDYIEGVIDLEDLFSTNSDTFGVRVKGDALISEGILPNDLLIVDRSLRPASQDIVIVAVEGQLTIVRLSHANVDLWLVPSESGERSREMKRHRQMTIWGVVTWVLHPTRHIQAAISVENRLEQEG